MQFRECIEVRKELCNPHVCTGFIVYAKTPNRFEAFKEGEK